MKVTKCKNLEERDLKRKISKNYIVWAILRKSLQETDLNHINAKNSMNQWLIPQFVHIRNISQKNKPLILFLRQFQHKKVLNEF